MDDAEMRTLVACRLPLQPFYEGWSKHQAVVIDALRDLTPEQLSLRIAPINGRLAIGR